MTWEIQRLLGSKDVMRQKQVLLLGLGLLVALAIAWLPGNFGFWFGGQARDISSRQTMQSSSVMAQTPPEAPGSQTLPPTVPTGPDTQQPIVLPSNPTPVPSGTASPTPGGSPKPTPAATPQPSPSPTLLPTPPLSPATSLNSLAAPLPLAETPYTDPANRFKVGLLKGFMATPLAGSVLVEALDGNLAYTVVAQTQPTSPIGLTPGFNTDALAQAANLVFQRGEGFQTGLAQSESGGGAVMDWNGSLTIGGKTQPVSGKLLVRPSARTILFLLVAATDASKEKIPGAIAALADTLQILP
jgi:hypothetical protein